MLLSVSSVEIAVYEERTTAPISYLYNLKSVLWYSYYSFTLRYGGVVIK